MFTQILPGKIWKKRSGSVALHPRVELKYRKFSKCAPEEYSIRNIPLVVLKNSPHHFYFPTNA